MAAPTKAFQLSICTGAKLKAVGEHLVTQAQEARDGVRGFGMILVGIELLFIKYSSFNDDFP